MEFYGTLGDACWERETLEALFRAGMTGARLNLSHTTLEACAPLLEERFWPAARQAGVEAKLIVDLQGPELRVGTLKEPVSLAEGAEVLLGAGGIPVPAAALAAARTGDEISLDDSALLLTVVEERPDALLCQVERGGLLKSRKSMAILGVQPDTPALTEEDRKNLDWAARCGVTDVLQPFVRGAEDLKVLRGALAERGLDRVRVMAKIENQQGMEKLDEIIGASDVICIARGDLGNSMPLWELPAAQKHIAARCRAEVCDIYNAVLDGSDALMLTGETAVGRYPAQAMEYLVKTARSALRTGSAMK